MDTSTLTRISNHEWRIEPQGDMRVPGIIFASQSLVEAMDEKVREQVTHVATLPGIIAASCAMPDAHWGYGFPIGRCRARGGPRAQGSNTEARGLHQGLIRYPRDHTTPTGPFWYLRLVLRALERTVLSGASARQPDAGILCATVPQRRGQHPYEKTRRTAENNPRPAGQRSLSLGPLNTNPDAPISSMRHFTVMGPGNQGCWKPAVTLWIRWICALQRRQ